MIVTRKHLHRRTFLKGMGAVVALPVLDAMTPAFASAAQAAKAPVRLAFTYVPNGIVMADWTPTVAGRGFEYTRILKPLEKFRAGDDDPVGPRAQERICARRRPRRPRARGCVVPDRRAPEEDRRRRHPERHLGRPGCRAAPRLGDALRLARARLRRLAHGRQLRFRLFVCVHEQPRVARTGDADAPGNEPATGVRAAVRRHRYQPRPGRPRAPAAVSPQHPRSRRRTDD